VTGENFEAILREALRRRDDQRRARLLDMGNYAAADALFVKTVLEAAGFTTPEAVEKVMATGKVARRKNRAAAFGDLTCPS